MDFIRGFFRQDEEDVNEERNLRRLRERRLARRALDNEEKKFQTFQVEEKLSEDRIKALRKTPEFWDDPAITLPVKISMIKHVLMQNKVEGLVRIEKFLINLLQEDTVDTFKKFRIVDDFNRCRNGMMLYKTTEWIHYTTIELFWILYKSNITTEYKLHALNFLLKSDIQQNRKIEAITFLRDYAVANQATLSDRVLANIVDLLINCEFPEIRETGNRLMNFVRAREQAREQARLLDDRLDIPFREPPNVFRDTQNVHDSTINNSIKESLEILGKDVHREGDRNILSQNPIEVLDDIQKELITRNLSKNVTMESLQRIATDFAYFTTTYKFRLRDIIQRVWNRIVNYMDSEEREEAIKRLAEELTDMAGMCSTGHMSRLVNVLSGFKGGLYNIRISWEAQINTNVLARVQKFLKNADEDLLTAMIGTTEEEKKPYIDFLVKIKTEIKEELRKEFQPLFDVKSDDVLTEKKFEEFFEIAFKKFL